MEARSGSQVALPDPWRLGWAVCAPVALAAFEANTCWPVAATDRPCAADEEEQ
jgi:hypothetical protein